MARSNAQSLAGSVAISIRIAPAIGQGQEILGEIAFFRRAQSQGETAVIVVNDVAQRGEATIVIEPALGVRP